MHLITAQSAEVYLRKAGHLDDSETARVTELTGGVSNCVLLVERSRGDRFVLKQAREQLKTEQEWRCSVERIWREVAVLKHMSELVDGFVMLPDESIAASLPEIVFEDRENYLYAMTAAPPEHTTWKQQLLAGKVHSSVATAAGQLLGRIHAESWLREDLASEFDDRTFFEALRIDPYYRRIAEVHPELRGEIELLIDSVMRHRRALVHGDFSPKNLLVWDDQLMLIDFEVGHYGDPAFDNGFFLTHLLLKTLWAGPRRADYMLATEAFWSAYRHVVQPRIGDREWLALEERSVFNLAGCLLARVDGKSPVDYLDEPQREKARTLASHLFREPPESVEEVLWHAE